MPSKSKAALVDRAILILLAALALALAAPKGLLAGVHWDAPIYLYQAKRFAETRYLANYTRHASEVAAQVQSGHLPPGEEFSDAYWHFARLGNTAILGAVVALFGSTLSSIRFASWLYTSLLIGGIGLCLAAVVALGRATGGARPWFAGAAISALLFFLSDIFRYLSGNVVGEVPAVFLLGGAVLSLLHSIRSGRLAFALLSGLLAFLSYTVRAESVWTWLMFLVAYPIARGENGAQPVLWKPLLAAGSSALALYAAYAAAFHPLADPRYFVSFALDQRGKFPSGVPVYELLCVAGGLLWTGALSSLRWLSESRLVRLGWLWLALSALPWLPCFLLGVPCQTRMLAVLIPPLFLLSSAGWTSLVESNGMRSRAVVAGIALCLAAISLPAVYGALHNLPVGWRVQFVRPFLYVPKRERLDYFPEEQAALSRAVYGVPGSAVVISGPAILQENLDLIRFFGPSYSPDSDLTLAGDPTNRVGCDDRSLHPGERVLWCTGYSSPTALNAARTRNRVLVLQQAGAPPIAGTTLAAQTPHFSLAEFRQ